MCRVSSTFPQGRGDLSSSDDDGIFTGGDGILSNDNGIFTDDDGAFSDDDGKLIDHDISSLKHFGRSVQIRYARARQSLLSSRI